MRNLKKRTIALILASVVTVVGAFGANNYKNSIMSLKFDGTASDNISMTVLTKTNYTNTLNTVKRDAQTYVIMLPETNSEMQKSPEISGNIESVDVRTMPYTTSANGYTKITVKTRPNISLTATNALFVPKTEGNQALPESSTTYDQPFQNNQPPSQSFENIKPRNREQSSSYNNYNSYSSYNNSNYTTAQNNNTSNYNNNYTDKNQSAYNTQNETQEPDVSNNQPAAENYQAPDNSSGTKTEFLYIILGTLLMISVIAFLFIKSKNKMAEIIGEQGEFDIKEESEQKPETTKKEKQQKIKAAINSLDKMYQKPVRMPIQQSLPEMHEEHNRAEIAEDANIIDLDDLFKEQNKTSKEEDNDDVFDDFLNDFLSDSTKEDEEEEAKAIIDEKEKYNEELFNELINNDSVKFTQNDIEKIDKLLNSEISDEFLDKMEKLEEIRIANNQPNVRTLDNLVAELMISKNITFTSEDIKALDKLMSVELDSDFVNDLRTNPRRTQEMTWEILNNTDNKKHNLTEILTMKVQDALPNLSEELKKHKGKEIEQEVKHDIVYYESGYDVQVLSVDEMPNLGIEIQKSSIDNSSRPSDDIIWPEDWEKTYDTPTINVSDNLPDLADVQKNPEKYTDSKPKVHVDEKALEKNLESVVFKPFYDGKEPDKIFETQSFDEEQKITETEVVTENTEQDNVLQNVEMNDKDIADNTELTTPETDSDKITELKEESGTLIEPEIKVDIPVPVRPVKERTQDEQTANLLNTINSQKEKREKQNKDIIPEEKPAAQKTAAKQPSVNDIKCCILEGVMYQIIASSSFADNIGCYLATSDEEGYSILGYIGDKIFKIKNYERIQNPTLNARKSEKLENGAIRYIVRIGIHKFILNVTDDNMEYVMDLC